MINIALISHTSALAGAERMLFNMALILKESDIYNPIVYMPNGPSKALEDICSSNEIEYRKMGAYSQYIFNNSSNSSNNYNQLLEATNLIKEQLVNDNVELILNNTATSLVGQLIGNEIQIPVIGWIHGILDSGLFPGDFDYEKRLFLDRIFIQLSDRVLCCSDWVKYYYNKYGQNKMFTLYNWTPEPKELIECESDNKTFVCLNTLDEIKGIFVLLEATKMLKDNNKNFKLLMYGDGAPKIKEKIEKYIEENNLEDCVELMGRTNDISRVYNSTLCLVQPSFVESFGMTIIEAMAHNRPVIATKCGGPQEIIKDKENGFLIAKNNARELADKMEYMLDHPEVAKEMGNQSRRIYKSKFSVEIAKMQIENMIQQVLNDYNGVSIEKRLIYDLLMEYLKASIKKNIEVTTDMDMSTDKIEVPVTPINSAVLRFSRPIRKKRYNMLVEKESITSIGIILASDKFANRQLEGIVTMNIYFKNKLLRSVSTELKNVKQNCWTYFTFTPLSDCKNRKITIELACDSIGMTQYVGIFEDSSKRTFSYKLCDKLRIPAQGLDVLYIDYK